MKFNFSKYVWLNITIFFVSIAATNLLTKGIPIFMFFAGCFISQYLMAGKLIFVALYNALTGKGISFKKLESSISVRIFIVVSCILIMGFSFFGWVAGWEGQTGIFYGFGVLVGSIIFDLGLGSACKEYLQKYKSLA